MSNPFLRRATEYIRDDTAFLGIVSPAPLTMFLAEHPRNADLFELPVRILGAPGSGKTMLAMNPEFRLVAMTLRDTNRQTTTHPSQPLTTAGSPPHAHPPAA